MEPGLFDFCRENTAFQSLKGLPFLKLDMRYASCRNLCGVDLYEGESDAWLAPEAVAALAKAAETLQILHPGWRFRIYDAARPLSVQRRLFAAVAGSPQQAYVADPAIGSVHNYGYAVDLGLEDAQGREQDFGTPFDAFDPLAHPEKEEGYLREGRLSGRALQLRKDLRAAMVSGGFRQHPLEWWHYDLLSLEEAKRRAAPFLGRP
jgi:D-alanyl-D-alanine dipeptidase